MKTFYNKYKYIDGTCGISWSPKYFKEMAMVNRPGKW